MQEIRLETGQLNLLHPALYRTAALLVRTFSSRPWAVYNMYSFSMRSRRSPDHPMDEAFLLLCVTSGEDRSMKTGKVTHLAQPSPRSLSFHPNKTKIKVR